MMAMPTTLILLIGAAFLFKYCDALDCYLCDSRRSDGFNRQCLKKPSKKQSCEAKKYCTRIYYNIPLTGSGTEFWLQKLIPCSNIRTAISLNLMKKVFTFRLGQSLIQQNLALRRNSDTQIQQGKRREYIFIFE